MGGLHPQLFGHQSCHLGRRLGGHRMCARAALGDGSAEQPAALRHRQQGRHAHRTRGLAADRDLRGIPAESRNVVLHPLQRRDLIQQPHVARAVGSVQEALGLQSVVDRHAHDPVAREGRPPVCGDRARTVHERPAVDPYVDRQPRALRVGRPDVEVEALLSRDDHLGQQRLVLRRIVPLRHRRAVLRRVPHTVPGRRRSGRLHPQLTERCGGVGHSEIRGHTVIDGASQLTLLDPDVRCGGGHSPSFEE